MALWVDAVASSGWLPESLVPLSSALAGAAVVVLVVVVKQVVDWMRALDTKCRDVGSRNYLEDPNTLAKVPLPSVFMPHAKSLSVVFPAYNEEDRLPNTLAVTLRYLEARVRRNPSFSYEVVVVDDGSRDNTVNEAYEFVRKHSVDVVRVVEQPCNQGKGAAVRKGALCARGALILFADADNATRIEDMEKLERQISLLVENASDDQRHSTAQPTVDCNSSMGMAAASDGVQLWAAAEEVAAAAFGSRAHLEQQALATRKWYRNVLMVGFHCAVVIAAGTGVRDTQCGFKMFTRAAARQLFVNQRLERWCFDVELFSLCQRLHIPVAEVAVNWTEVAGSKLRITSILHMLLELAIVFVGHRCRLWTLHRAAVRA